MITKIAIKIVTRTIFASSFLDALAKLRRATISFVMLLRLSFCLSTRPPAHKEQLASHRMDFHEI
jgi:hypothetical protein